MQIKNTLSRRDFLRVSAGVTSVALLAACAPGAAPSGSGAAAPATGRVEITFMGWGATEEDEGVKAAIAQFESEQDTIKVTWLHTPENYLEKLLTDIAAGTPPDTAFVGSGDYRTFIRDGLLLDITDKLTADPLLGAEDYFIEPQERDRCTQDGKWYGIGSCWVAPHIYYNADIFAEEGIEPPSNDPEQAWTWDRFVEVAIALTRDVNGRHPNEGGFDPDNIDRFGVDWPHWSIPVHSAIVGNNGYWIDPNTGLLAIDQAPATEAIQNVADLVLKHRVNPAGTAMEALGMSNTQMLETGKLAMAIDGSWALSWMHKIAPTLGTAALPGMAAKTGTDMQAHLHSGFASTRHPEEAWQWLRFLSTPFYQTQFCRIGLWLPSQSDLMTEQGLQTWITEGVHPEGYVDIPTKFLPRYGRVLYMPPGWAEANQILQPAFDKIWIGDATAEQALAEAVPAANRVLQEAAEA
ncbi:MAG: sugar ABC transporter substrate-binding protein [Caldilinea sp.]|jgi:multiple sugar transport system substrate-binding protein|nr:sugar ABC transporter substrate-binding protein [Caldilinea sp.]